MAYVSPMIVRKYLNDLGYGVQPVTNSVAVAQYGADLKIVGYDLLGPRGNKGFLACDEDGKVCFTRARLWADCVAYATAKIRERNRP